MSPLQSHFTTPNNKTSTYVIRIIKLLHHDLSLHPEVTAVSSVRFLVIQLQCQAVWEEMVVKN